MRKTLLWFVCLQFMLVGTALGKNLIIMGWDGAGLRNVNLLLAENKLPNLAGFLEAGAHLIPLECIGSTVTMTSWVQALTGLTYDQTGVLGNGKFETDFGGVLNQKYNSDWHTFPGLDFFIAPVPFKHTIFKPLKEQGEKIGYFVSKPLGALIRVKETADVALKADPKKVGDKYIDDLGAKTVDFIQHHEGFVVFFHVTPDCYGHEYGENGQRYLDEFVRADEWLGKVLAKLDANTTKVIVMADHGFDEGQKHHHNAPDAWMATNLPVHSAYWLQEKQRAFGTMRDVAPTILEWYGIDYTESIPQIRGKSLLE